MILVTGGAGYIGSHACVELLNAGHEVVVFDNFSNSHPEALKRVQAITGKTLQVVEGDIREQRALEDAIRRFGCTSVIHFAGLKAVGESVEKPLDYYDNNVVGTHRLLQAMGNCGVKTLVFSSSATVYGEPQFLPLTEQHPLSATNPYGRTKLVIEDMLRDLYRSDSSWRIGILRYFNPVGAHESGLIGEDPQGTPNNLMPFVAQVAVGRREILKIWGNDYPTPDGTGVRDYIHVVDLAKGHLKALQRLDSPMCYAANLGTGTGYSVLEVAKAFAEASGRSVRYEIAPRRAGDVAACYAEASHAEQLLGWRAERDLPTMCLDAWRWQSKNPYGFNHLSGQNKLAMKVSGPILLPPPCTASSAAPEADTTASTNSVGCACERYPPAASTAISQKESSLIPYGKQDINEEDIKAVQEVLRSDFLTQGPMVPEFERALAQYCGSQYAVAVNSATSALHLACLALGVAPGDTVWTTPITFVATANCALYCGAQVDFVDIDPMTYNLCPNRLREKLEHARARGTLPKVVIAVHLCGQSCDMEEIHVLSIEFGFRIIEDASHAVGGTYKGKPIGSCEYSDITVFSFHPVKIITSGEGGMAITNDSKLYAIMQRLRSHGVTRDPQEMSHAPDGPWYYQQIDLGFNYRMTDIQAALGLSQLKRLDTFVNERHRVAETYDRLLAGFPATAPLRDAKGRSAFHLYIVRLDLARLRTTQREVFERLRANGIMVNLHYIPVYHHPYYRERGHATTSLPEAERYYAEAITLPLYTSLKEEQQREVVERMRSPLGFQTLF